MNDRNAKKYKFVRTENSCVAAAPGEIKIKSLTKKFLKSYYEIFDQPGRANLESQYSADAFFSFSSTHPMPTVGRNLLEIREPQQRLSMLVHDKTNIARALATFSPTEHLFNYLTTDVPFYIANPLSVTSMQLVVTGVFKDTSQTTNLLRAFTRVFALKLKSIDTQGEPSYEVYNDLFMLQAPTPDQIKRFHQDSQTVKRTTETIQQGRPNASTASGGLRSRDDLVELIMTKTKMNKESSTKLLQENDWDEAKSIAIFNQLILANKIPQELFTP